MATPALAQSAPWAADGWGWRQQVVFTQNPATADLDQFAVLVRLDAARIDYAQAAVDGTDLRFFDADGTTPLAYEIESWDPLGESWVWVAVPVLNQGNADFIWMYYGNPSATDGQDPAAVWDSSFQMVQHFSGGSLLDSTFNAVDLTEMGGTLAEVAGPIGTSRDFPQNGRYLTTGTVDLSQWLGGTATLEVWMRTSLTGPADSWRAPAVTGVNWDGKGSSASVAGIHWGWMDDSQRFCMSANEQRNDVSDEVRFTNSANTWQYATMTRDSVGRVHQMFRNGTLARTRSNANGDNVPAGQVGPAFFDIGRAAGTGTEFKGQLDEVRISNVVRSATWIATQHASMTDNLATYWCDGAPTDWYEDADGDGFTTAVLVATSCAQPAHTAPLSNPLDCEDTVLGRFGVPGAKINPAAQDICNNIDDNCNGQFEENPDIIWFPDVDGDLYGDDQAVGVARCNHLPDTIDNNGDCDDANSAVHPGVTEVPDRLDNDCNTLVDDTTIAYDDDGDGFCEGWDDPNDLVSDLVCTDTSVPIDCNDDDATTQSNTFWRDADADGYGDATSTVQDCLVPAGYAENDQDCNDSSDQAFPGGTEVPDRLDNDCNAIVDDTTIAYDDDKDGFCEGWDDPNDLVSDLVCTDTSVPVDCNDADPTTVINTYYVDFDADGYGDANFPLEACTAPSGYVADKTDCNDDSTISYPGATEIPDGLDNNCNNTVDEHTIAYDDDGDGFCEGWDDPLDGSPDLICTDGKQPYDCDDTTVAVRALRTYPDNDQDGFGDPLALFIANDCAIPAGYVLDHTDCDDTRADYNPNAVWYADLDGDQFGDASKSSATCLPPASYVPDNTDCDDGEVTTYPGAADVCGDGVDSNCDGVGWEGDDEDGDSILGRTERQMGSDDCSVDSDNDGVPDLIERDLVNTDGDELWNIIDPDDDNDGILTIDEDLDGNGDPTDDNSDDDALPNYLDPDDDNDDMLTADEDIDGDGDPRNDHSDDDGVPDYLDTDDDDDGVLTADEVAPGALTDWTSTDSDLDGIPDGDEYGPDHANPQDWDGDGIIDALDEDDDNDGISTLVEGKLDMDDGDRTDDTCDRAGDGIPNYLDIDSDGDGVCDGERKQNLGDQTCTHWESASRDETSYPPLRFTEDAESDEDGDLVPNYLDCNDLLCEGDACVPDIPPHDGYQLNGCGCATSSNPASSGSGVGALLLALVFGLRRRARWETTP